MNVSLKVGQIVTLPNHNESMMVKSVSEDGSTVELVTLTSVPTALRDVPVTDLFPLLNATSSDKPNIDRDALAGTKNSLGAESIRDGRPATDDQTIEAIDEERAGPTAPIEPKEN